MKREIRCPICGSIISVNFRKELVMQGGKNQFCPKCKWLLWVPVKGKPDPVPIPIIKK